MGAKVNLVLGGSGTVGSALSQYLIEQGEEVINVDIKNGPEFDIRTMDLSVYSHVDHVWFLAWDVGGAKYLTAQKNLINILHNNTLLCERVFSFLEETKIPFLFATTQLAEPDNTYGITKILGEEWTKLLNGKTARFWNVYGWEEPGERSHVMPDLIMQALQQKHIKLMTTGEEERQFIHVDDCVKNLVLIRESEQKDVDLTNGSWMKIKDLAALIASKLDATWEPGDKLGYNNKVEATKKLKDFNFDITFDKGIEMMIERAKEHIGQA